MHSRLTNEQWLEWQGQRHRAILLSALLHGKYGLLWGIPYSLRLYRAYRPSTYPLWPFAKWWLLASAAWAALDVGLFVLFVRSHPTLARFVGDGPDAVRSLFVDLSPFVSGILFGLMHTFLGVGIGIQVVNTLIFGVALTAILVLGSIRKQGQMPPPLPVAAFISMESSEGQFCQQDQAPKPSATAKRTTRNGVIFSVAVLFVALVGATVWPTAYRYDTLKIGNNSFPVRINRITGNAQYFTGGVWVGRTKRPAADRRPLPPDQLRRITGNARLEPSGFFRGDLYNGSEWVLTDLTVRVTAKVKYGVLWTRRFRTSLSDELRPLSVGLFSIRVTNAYGAEQAEWWLVAAKGYPEGPLEVPSAEEPIVAPVEPEIRAIQ